MNEILSAPQLRESELGAQRERVAELERRLDGVDGPAVADLRSVRRRRSARDVAKYLLVGADVVMTTSALLRRGPEYATVLLDGLVAWATRKGFRTLDELRGMLAVPADTDEAAYERAGYVSAMRAANARSYGPWL